MRNNQLMINRLSNAINRNRSAAKISKVMSSSWHTNPKSKSVQLDDQLLPQYHIQGAPKMSISVLKLKSFLNVWLYIIYTSRELPTTTTSICPASLIHSMLWIYDFSWRQIVHIHRAGWGRHKHSVPEMKSEIFKRLVPTPINFYFVFIWWIYTHTLLYKWTMLTEHWMS